MKKVILGILVVFGFFSLNSYVGSIPVFHCNTTVDFDISDPDQLKDYVMNHTWTVVETHCESKMIRGKQIRVSINENLVYSIYAGVYEDENLNNALNNIGRYGSGVCHTGSFIQYHDAMKRYPYYEAGRWGNNFIEIAEDHYTMESCDSSSCEVREYRKEEIEEINFDGTYEYNGKTLIIEGRDLYHKEADIHYTIHQTDYNRITITGQVISEIPSYRFWLDEEGNITLFSDGINVYDKEEQEILKGYPFYVLSKQKNVEGDSDEE